MQRAPNASFDDTTTPVIVCGVLAGLAGAVVGMIPASLVSLIRGDGLTMPARLVAALLMGHDALDRENVLAAALLGMLITTILAGLAGVAFAWLRRGETRFRLLAAEGAGFALVLFGVVWVALPYINPMMYRNQSPIVLAIAYAMFGATLALELPLRAGTIDAKEAREVLGQTN